MPVIEEKTLQERFEEYHEDHPEIYAQFKAIAADLLLNRNRKHYGAKAIMEVVRYHRIVSGEDEMEPFKINNNYTSRYARMLIDEDERFEDFFETRQLLTP